MGPHHLRLSGVSKTRCHDLAPLLSGAIFFGVAGDRRRGATFWGDTIWIMNRLNELRLRGSHPQMRHDNVLVRRLEI
jgi:hypothetical protein